MSVDQDPRGVRFDQVEGGEYLGEYDKPLRLPDLDRIERQQILIGRLLEEGYDFLRALVDLTLVAMSSAMALQSLALNGSRQGWSSRTYPKVEPVTIDGKKVLVRRRARWLPRWAPEDGR